MSDASSAEYPTLMRTLVTLLAIGAVMYLAVCGALFFFQRSLIDAEEIELKTADGHRLHGWFVRNNDGASEAPALIYFGGNAENVSASLPMLSAAFPDRAIYAMHYRGYGGSSGAPSEEALQDDALLLFDQVYAQHPNILVMGRSLGSRR